MDIQLAASSAAPHDLTSQQGSLFTMLENPSNGLIVLRTDDRLSVTQLADGTYTEIANLPYAVGEYVITVDRRSHLIKVDRGEDDHLTISLSPVRNIAEQFTPSVSDWL